MRAAIFQGTGDIRVEDVPDAHLQEPADVVVRVTHACICGSDLWFYRGQGKSWKPGHRTGHEFMGVVEETGAEVRTLRRGDRVIAPFTFNCGECEFCRKGVQTSCVRGGVWGQENDGGQGEALRVPLAEATLVTLPTGIDDNDPLLRRVLPLTDVFPTGHHAVVMAGGRRGGTVAVIGDGAVGLGAVLAARRLGAGRIIVFGHHQDRLRIARDFGATDVVTARGDEAIEEVRQLTGGHGAEAVAECVGTQESLETAVAICRPGGGVGLVGVPHGDGSVPIGRLFSHNISLRFGVAPVRAYLDDLLADVLDGSVDPSQMLTHDVGIEEVPEGYRLMDQREAIKVAVVAA